MLVTTHYISTVKCPKITISSSYILLSLTFPTKFTSREFHNFVQRPLKVACIASQDRDLISAIAHLAPPGLQHAHKQHILNYKTFSFFIFAFSILIGIFCGSVLPGPVLLNNSQNATLLFSSDINRAGSGFIIRHQAVGKHYDPGGKSKTQSKHADTVQNTATHVSSCNTTACLQCRLIFILLCISVFNLYVH